MMILFVAMIFVVSNFINLKYEESVKDPNSILVFVYGICIPISIKIFQVIWSTISEFYVHKENYRYQNHYTDSKALKQFIFS